MTTPVLGCVMYSQLFFGHYIQFVKAGLVHKEKKDCY